jgi:hypothetical protein
MRARTSLPLSLLLAVTIFAAVTPTLRADNGSQTPMDAAKEYTRLCKSGEVSAAIQRYWDFSTLLQIICRDDLNRYSEPQRADMAGMLREAVKGIMSHPRITTEMKKASFEAFEQKQMSPTLTAIRFYATFADGRRVANTLVFQNRQPDAGPGDWHIVNAAVNGGLLVGAQLHAEYVKTEMSPMDYVTGLYQMSHANAGQ